MKTLSSLGSSYGLTRERIRQIEEAPGGSSRPHRRRRSHGYLEVVNEY